MSAHQAPVEIDEAWLLRGTIEDARDIAAAIRLHWDRNHEGGERDRMAATLLLTLADELERARPELRVVETEE